MRTRVALLGAGGKMGCRITDNLKDCPDDDRTHVTGPGIGWTESHPPGHCEWADPAYDVAHSSIVACNRDLLKALRGAGEAQTTGRDSLETMRLVFGGCESAACGRR
jgi:hypothetical protein